MRVGVLLLLAGCGAASSGLLLTGLQSESVPAATEAIGFAEATRWNEAATAADAATGPTLQGRSELQDDAAPPGLALVWKMGMSRQDAPAREAAGAAPLLPKPADKQLAHDLTRLGCLVSVGTDGNLSYELKYWTARYGQDGYALAAYDLAPLAATASDLCEALRGYRQDGDAQAPVSPWWQGLCENLVWAVGRDRWPAPATQLAWDPASAMLYVRQDADGQRRVEEFLEPLVRGRLGTIGVEAHMETPPDGVGPLTLQVPWSTSVRAHEGSTYLYVQDFEVEVAQGSFISDPIVANVDTGFAISARRVEGRDYLGDLEVEIAYASGRPDFERFDTTLASEYVPVSIEIPHASRAFWRGRVPASRGAYAIRLDDGRRVRLVVHGQRACAPVVRNLARRQLPTPSSEQGTGPSKARRLRIAVEVAGEERTCDMDLVPKDRVVASSLRVGSLVVPATDDPTMSPVTGTLLWPQPEGGLRIQARSIAVEEVEVIDLVLERAWPADETRFSGGVPSGADSSAPKWPTLPVSRVRTQSLHVDLPPGGEAIVPITGASGRTGFLRLTLVTVAEDH